MSYKIEAASYKVAGTAGAATGAVAYAADAYKAELNYQEEKKDDYF